MIGLFNDPIMEVRNQAVEAAASLGTAALDRMITALRDERWRVREHADTHHALEVLPPELWAHENSSYT